MQSSPREGVVLRVDARAATVLSEGVELTARLRGRLFEIKTEDAKPLAVGDRVLLSEDQDGPAIDAVLPRTNFMARRASGDEVRRQLIAANVDQVVVVACFGNPPFSSITTDRIIASAEFHNVPAALVLNKTDRDKKKQLGVVRATYEEAGYRVVATSAEKGEGLDDFRELLHDKTSVLSGMSGVGKSTLLNAIEDGLGIRTREVSRSLKSGRHTTTFARMFPLAMGGSVIDTPGVRVFRLFGIAPTELRLLFPEMEKLGPECKFSSCTHRHEPGCAVLAAIEAETFPASRYRSYCEIMDELEATYGGAGVPGEE